MPRKPDLAVVGKSQPRLDGFDKLSGRSVFTDDVQLPGMLHARTVRSTLGHARILNVDTSAAERVPGVKCVLTRDDVASLAIGPQQPLLDATVRFIGQEIALVAATDEDAAFEAAARVRVEYEPLPVVTSIRKAMEPGAAQLHAKAAGNVAWDNKETYGDPDRSFAECEVVVEGDYASNPTHNCYAEFHAVVADWSRAEKLTMWTPTQSAVLFQKGLVDVFGLSEGNVRLMTLNTGGAFTGRGLLRPHHYLAAALSRKARRPVKIRAYSDEEFLMGRAGGRNEYRFRSGAMRDGKLRVIEADMLFDSGAYLESQSLVTYLTASYMHWLHAIEAMRYRGRLVYTNNMPYWFHHGGGIAQMAWAWGQHLDAVAKAVGMDPVEFHLRNAVEKGHTTMTGTHFASCGLKECIQKAAAKSGWMRKFGKLPSGKGRAKGFSKGIGIGLSAMASGAKGRFTHDTSAAFVKVAEDGTVTLATGIPDMGQGSHTTMAIIAAEVLGIAPTDVTIIAGDTDVTPFDMGAFSQRGTFMTGNAVKAAALDAREQLAKVAAEKLGCKASQLVFREHRVYRKQSPEQAIPFGKLVHDTLHSKEGRAVMGRGFFNSPLAKGSMAYSFGAQVAEVTIDHETGLVRVDRVTCAHDLGRAINPKAVEGQIDGQVFSGMSQVLFEELVMDDGQPLNPSRLEYKLPRSYEVPEVQHILVETIDPYGPFGAKEVGEGPIVASMSAIGNAVANALGEHIEEMPITPWRVLRALGRQGE
jgi:4-hydroxybenzoyl-CoA reductase subunit alpha